MREIGSAKIMMMMMMMMMVMMMMIVIVIMVKIMVIMTGSFYNHLSKICISINTTIIDLLLLSTSPIIDLQLLLLLLIICYVRIQHRLHELLQASASTEHARRSLELEKADLLQTYRVVLQEKRRLEEDMNSIR
jgi:hypothetical protein